MGASIRFSKEKGSSECPPYGVISLLVMPPLQITFIFRGRPRKRLTFVLMGPYVDSRVFHFYALGYSQCGKIHFKDPYEKGHFSRIFLFICFSHATFFI
jgi:hypothetical protein